MHFCYRQSAQRRAREMLCAFRSAAPPRWAFSFSVRRRGRAPRPRRGGARRPHMAPAETRHQSDRGSHSRDTRVSASRAPEVAQGTRELRTFRSLVGLGERHVLTEAPHVCGDKTRDTLSKNMPTSTHATSKCSKSLSLSLWCRAFVRSTPPTTRSKYPSADIYRWCVCYVSLPKLILRLVLSLPVSINKLWVLPPPLEPRVESVAAWIAFGVLAGASPALGR